MRLTVKRLKEILDEIAEDDFIVRVGSDEALRFDYLEEVGSDNDCGMVMLYFGSGKNDG